MVMKYLLDRVFSCILLIVLCPLFILISVLIKLDSKGPVIFIQQRVGKNQKLFNIYKFRTMIPDAVNIGNGVYTEENDPRITRIGRFLRKTSLDELPQLLNIFWGDMSFIGPRPTLEYQVKQYSDFQKKRLIMKPGVTGLAQISGRNSISWPERIKYDVQYVENWSLGLDLKIFLKTFSVIFKREGLYGEKEKFLIKDEMSNKNDTKNI
ncbi:sugar transferase [Ruminiclostridium cellobioparum]|uniref:sugar transferase n=1 Tax=Ruminiclostridium cellobioparum TaxID=29355 RepID=UPI000481D3F1|nr:sugar transferase [Ruminiclostridium cellobioparum]